MNSATDQGLVRAVKGLGIPVPMGEDYLALWSENAMNFAQQGLAVRDTLQEVVGESDVDGSGPEGQR